MVHDRGVRCAGRAARGPVGALVDSRYRELRRLAAWIVRQSSVGPQVQPTALVHEAYIRLATWPPKELHDGRGFMSIAARVVRQVLVDQARSQTRQRRGGGWQRVPMQAAAEYEAVDPVEVLALDEALETLARRSERQAQVVELKCFGGMTTSEVSQALGVSSRTVEKDWSVASAWLRVHLRDNEPATV